ncbi:MAG: SPW repeat domain-containing protein [Candidatus Cyclobacteriaceae bacterium M3_2C_046]
MELSFKNLFFVKKETFDPEKQEKHENHHQKFCWVYYATMVLGFWLIAGPLTFDYKVDMMFWNDIIAGFILIFLSYQALKPYKLWAQWAIIFLGIWLFIAPLIFHVRNSPSYLTDFLVGTLVITFALIIARQPGIKLYAVAGPDIPPGWSYNPSSWPQRIPVIFLAWVGFFIARYMGAFQMEMIDTVWDPVFGDGTKDVLTSKVSESFPVSDAALGAFSYILDVLFGYAGGVHRWRTMPWVVIIFGILIVPLGVVSITLIILQPLSVGSWCTLCLSSAVISVIMIPFTLDEVLATSMMIRQEMKKGKSFWSTFWFGGSMEGGEIKEKLNPVILIPHTLKEMLRDLSTRPWNLFAIAAIGIWLMLSPNILGYGGGSMADSDHFVGALVITFAIITMSDVARPGRFIFILFGLWFIAAPWIFGTDYNQAIWNGSIAGVLLILLSFRKGKITDTRGEFDRFIK